MFLSYSSLLADLWFTCRILFCGRCCCCCWCGKCILLYLLNYCKMHRLLFAVNSVVSPFSADMRGQKKRWKNIYMTFGPHAKHCTSSAWICNNTPKCILFREMYSFHSQKMYSFVICLSALFNFWELNCWMKPRNTKNKIKRTHTHTENFLSKKNL